VTGFTEKWCDRNQRLTGGTANGIGQVLKVQPKIVDRKHGRGTRHGSPYPFCLRDSTTEAFEFTVWAGPCRNLDTNLDALDGLVI